MFVLQRQMIYWKEAGWLFLNIGRFLGIWSESGLANGNSDLKLVLRYEDIIFLQQTKVGRQGVRVDNLKNYNLQILWSDF